MYIFNDNSNIMFDNNPQFERYCEKCNTSLSEIVAEGNVGCANCYITFKNEIRDILIKKQGNFNHIGKVATKRISKQKLEEQIADLEKQKQDAVDSEDFIVAESLKNQIEKLRGSF